MKEIYKLHEYFKNMIFETVDSDHSRWLTITENKLKNYCFYSVEIFIPLESDIFYDLLDFNHATLCTFEDLEVAYDFVKQMMLIDSEILLDKVNDDGRTNRQTGTSRTSKKKRK